MKGITNEALQAAHDAGADYAETRIVENQSERFDVKNGRLETSSQRYSLGLGIRVLVGGSWGFAATSLLEQDRIIQTARSAVEIGRASARINREMIELTPVEIHRDKWSGVCVLDPRRVPSTQKIEYLMDVDARIRSVQGISISESFMEFHWIHTWFANSAGSWIEQEYPVSGVGLEATAIRGHDLQVRSYPNSMTGQFEGCGYELIEKWRMTEHAQRIASEAVQLLDARTCPEGIRTVIIDSTQLALQIHESCGHAVELDRVLGSEINDYGTSFLTPDKLGTFHYGSQLVNLTADPTILGGLGSFGYDDEGVKAERCPIVQHGIFLNYLSSRETAARIGLDKSNASMRAQNYNYIPLVRMTNLNLEPGRSSTAEMISTTQDGVLVSTNKSFSIDDRRWQFQFGTEIGWLIKNGRITDMVKNPIYSGVTPEFWRSCDAIANQDEWVLWGIPNCGKGQPDQGARVSHGCSPARFVNIRTGGIRA
ncbi:TldD/PmbA family protein [bacterium]|nr:TldD/PmbA family protein [bacterium]